MSRLSKLRDGLKREGLEALVVTQPENRRYLSGFTGSAGALLISQEEARIFVDFRYVEQAKAQAAEFRLIREDRAQALHKEFANNLRSSLQELGLSRVGFESLNLSVYQHQAWQETLDGMELMPTTDLVEELRAVKERAEIELIRKAAALTDEAYNHMHGLLRAGITEREASWAGESYMRTHGAEGVAFEFLVQAGPHGALPHWVAAEEPIKAGEPLIMDMGSRVDGYHSDLTRTVFMGKSDSQFQKIFDIVRKAQETALHGIRPGMKGEEADALARKVIEEAGYGEYFGHGLGHGVGLAIHEKPWVRRTSQEELRPGMLITVEPGIYLPGWGGVRIEDLALVVEDGLEVLSQASKDPWRK